MIDPIPAPPIESSPFGQVEGRDVDLYTLTNAQGLAARVTTFGATLTSLLTPDRHGTLADVVLGFDGLHGYLNDSPYFGATAGRIANRIRNARFQLEDGGPWYVLAANDGPHHLHGGMRGWDKVVWSAEAWVSPDGPALRLRYLSAGGEEGYPGTVQAVTVYTLTNDDELRIEMSATTDQATIVNMVHHTYWNLSGDGAAPITDHHLRLYASNYTPGDPVVPTGVEAPVQGTPFDFTAGKPIGRDLSATGGVPVGYDHNFIVDGPARSLRPVARLRDPKSGRVMALQADQPGVQFYSGNFLDGKLRGKGGQVYPRHAGLCLETQRFPNAVNVPAWKSQVVLSPGQTYKHTMIHRFTAE